MKKFEEASLEVIEFNAQDVIATSGEPCTEDGPCYKQCQRGVDDIFR